MNTCLLLIIAFGLGSTAGVACWLLFGPAPLWIAPCIALILLELLGAALGWWRKRAAVLGMLPVVCVVLILVGNGLGWEDK